MHNNIRELRTDQLLTQKDLVTLCNIPGFDVPTLSRIENGKVAPTEQIENAIMLILRCTKDELYGEWKEVNVKGLGNKELIENPPMQVLELISHLKYGRQNAKSRRLLKQEMDIHDRTLRRTIALASKYGYCIGNLSDSEGYFLIANDDEAKAYYKQELSRAMQIMEHIAPIQKQFPGVHL